jgi:hypothetical protein
METIEYTHKMRCEYDFNNLWWISFLWTSYENILSYSSDTINKFREKIICDYKCDAAVIRELLNLSSAHHNY